ncbi:response regulator transcription factor [uncultured Abiotrophia sp.]|uniref:response regulator transcription factor n=1 Tax=uncultured Abiotrophia sp. TaxID=316094 RepID=UPI00288B1C89|nr:response regulator transcription factor [uncultured Abiotrophia sp.]
MRILLAEDEQQLARVVMTALAHEGYQVDWAKDGQQAVQLAQQTVYDLMILDIMMPVKDGIEALKEIRASGHTNHVIMLTAMAEVDDRVTGLDAGADDYLTKPFSLKELLARLRSMSRRVDHYEAPQLALGNTQLKLEEMEVSANNAIRLAGKEAKLLALLMKNPGKALSQTYIYDHVWADEPGPADYELVNVYLAYLVQKLLSIRSNLQIVGQPSGPYQLLVEAAPTEPSQSLEGGD